jgi:C-terminal processing protease CtpA/Prc
MVEVADATVVGSPSFGEFSDAIDWVLPDGTEFTLSMENYTDLDGINHEATGIPVDAAAPFEQAVATAIDHLAAR